ncbi:MAG: restriction endonuclease subunit S [Elusimicrobia bacterium]|nr:restriction endonuclease subunit S [Elusimicrobiota bacterium]
MTRGWRTTKIGDVCHLVTGGTPSRAKPEYFGGGIKWLVSGDIHKKEITDCEGRITEAGMRNSNAKLLPVNSVLIALNGQGRTRGTVALLRTRATCNQSLVSISPTDPKGLLPEYLYANLHGRYEEIRRMTGDDGNERRGLTMRLIREIEIPIAPLSKQRRIVGMLDKAFAGVATAKANAEKNFQNVRGLFRSHLNSIFSKRGKGWLEDRVGAICDVKHGFAFDGAEFSSGVPKGNPLIVTPGNFTEDGKLLFNEKNTKRFRGRPLPEFLFRVGDLVVVMTDLSSKMKILGKPAFVETDNVLHNQRIGRVVFSNDRLEKRFLYYFMMTDCFLTNIKRSATGTMVKHTAPKRILSNLIPFPVDRTEQRAIIAQLDSLHQETKHLESVYRQKLASLEELKDSLLHQAFSGIL